MSHAADGHLHPYIQGSLEEIFQEQDRYAMRVRWNGRLFQVRAAQVFAPSL